MKGFLTCITFLISSFVHAQQLDIDLTNSITHEKNSARQWGLDAIQIPQIMTPVNADLIGLKSGDNEFFTNNLLMETELLALSENSKTVLNLTSNSPSITPTINTLQEYERQYKMYRIAMGFTGLRFSAETMIVKSSSLQDEVDSIHFQGAYKLFTNNNLSIALTAKFELQESGELHQVYQFAPPHFLINPDNPPHTLNTTVGLVTTLRLTKNWQVFGTVSTHNIDNKLTESLQLDNKYIQRASITTRYSF